MEQILDTDSNCWRIARADRAAFVVDGEAYFAAVRQAILKASHSVFLVGWDMHSRIELVRETVKDNAPRELGALLNYCARRAPGLHIYVLTWDFAMIYSLERELFPHYRLQWKSHRRVEFCLDGNHPVGASQHQKLVVIDDCMAFAGGFDLAQWRWDTREHRIDDPRRRDPRGHSYPTFHDVQMAVSGAAARALGELARERWNGADGCEPVAMVSAGDTDCWPKDLEPALADVDVALALTRSEWNGQPGLRQVEQLFSDSIAGAQRFIYLENQYFTSQHVGDALAESLARDSGPQIIMVLPSESRGWLEHHTMDVLRSRLLSRLREADRHRRLRVYCPRLGKDAYLLVHAKIMVVDDDFLRIGSANLSNRSMGLDMECDAALESTARLDCSEAIAAFRRGLLAEHLGVETLEVARAEQQHDSLIDAVESLRGGERTLEELSHVLPEYLDRTVPDSAVIDPEKPINPRELFEYIVGDDHARLRPYLKLGLLVLAILALAGIWRWTPLASYLSLDTAKETVSWIKSSPFSPLLVLLAFTAGSLAVMPLTLMFVATVAVFGPWQGTVYSMLAAELAALVTYGVGYAMGKDAARRFGGGRFSRIRRKLASPGLVGIIALRIVPVAPFTVINIAAGALSVSLRDFALGSFLGMIPGILAIALLTDRVTTTLEVPDPGSILTLLGAAALVLLAGWVSRMWIRRSRSRQET